MGGLLHALGVDSSTLRSALDMYKYQAPRLSFLEALFLDRFWDGMATHVYPRWLAPNVITLLGGGCILAAALLGAWFSPSLRGEAPPWVYATNAVLLFLYQTLDGSDGKQARRTNSGSPLGELFDHGVVRSAAT
jgi:ethanolaminephosphotransferase